MRKHKRHGGISIDARPDIHCYSLCRGIREREDGTIIVDKLTFSMGEHGSLHVDEEPDIRENGDGPGTGGWTEFLAGCNIAEMKRAMEEGRKWDSRMRDSPLGKTQQDFVAYYSEVIAAFAEWCTAHGIPIPRC